MCYNFIVEGGIVKLQNKFYFRFLFRTVVATLFVYFGLYSAMIIITYANQQIVGDSYLFDAYLILIEIMVLLLFIHYLKNSIEKSLSIIRCEIMYWISLFATTAVIASYLLLTVLVRLQYNELYSLYNHSFNIGLLLMANLILVYTATVISGSILYVYFQILFPLSNKLNNKWITMGIIYGIVTVVYIIYGVSSFEIGNVFRQHTIIYSLLVYLGTIITLHYVADYFEENVYTADLEDEAVIIVQSNRIIYNILFLPVFIVRKYTLSLYGYLFQK